MDVIRHAQACALVGTLIIPEWQSAVFWSALMDGNSTFASFVKSYAYLPKRNDLIVPGPGQKLCYNNKLSVYFGCPNFRIIAIRFEVPMSDFTLIPIENIVHIVLRNRARKDPRWGHSVTLVSYPFSMQ